MRTTLRRPRLQLSRLINLPKQRLMRLFADVDLQGHGTLNTNLNRWAILGQKGRTEKYAQGLIYVTSRNARWVCIQSWATLLPQDFKRTIFSPEQAKEHIMRYSTQVKPISYLKANAAEVLTNLAEQQEPLVITQNGEAKAVLQDVASYENTQETLALLKILAIGNEEVAAGKLKPAQNVFKRLKSKPVAA